MPFLIIKKENSPPERLELSLFPFSIGRDTSCSYVTTSEDISRRHFQIKQRGRLFIVEDLNSRNGTFVNGEKVLNTTIQNGDTINVGSMQMTFVSSQDDIHVVTDFSNLDWQGQWDNGLSILEPVSITELEAFNSPRATRFDLQSLKTSAAKSPTVQKKTFGIYQDIQIFEDYGEAARVLLKSLVRLAPTIARAAFFVWNDLGRSILPIAHWQMGNPLPFNIHKQLLKDVVTRKSVARFKPQNQAAELTVFPMSHHDKLLGLIHIEADHPTSLTEDLMAQIYFILHSVSPLFETITLRNEMDSWLVGMVETIIAAVEAKDTYTKGHSERVCRYSMAIADELKLNREIKRMLMVSSLCHDIGKVGIPDQILKKASILSTEEYQEIKLHPTLGAEIIKHMPGYKRFLSGIKYHHEKWDGTGYPEGLIGEQIPFFGRIVAVSDVFDAMVSGRSYSGFMDQNEAVAKLQKERDLFDPQILDAFTRAFENGRLSLKTSTASNEPKPAEANSVGKAKPGKK